MVEVAQNYAVVALGISCFSCHSVSSIDMQDGKDEEQIRSHDYMVQTFNVLTMCTDPFTVECDSLKFLHNHGFDFNKLYAKGSLYYRGCDRKNDKSLSVRNLFTKLLEHRKSIIVHNGLIDLIFLYQSFYCDLPKKNDTFAADLDDLFPMGIYDTKYLAVFHQAVPATYLEYLFKKMQLKNVSRQRNGRWHVRLRFPPYPKHAPNIDWYCYLQIFSYRVEDDNDKRELCHTYAHYGFCNDDKCALSHNINRVVKVLQLQGAKKHRHSAYYNLRGGSLAHCIEKFTKSKEKAKSLKRKSSSDYISATKKANVNSKKTNETDEETKDTKTVVLDEVQPENLRSANGHRAGYDAFMTGFIFASIVSEKGMWTSKDNSFTPENIGLVDQVNKVHLQGKNFPFLIRTGTYANKSSKHCSKIEKVRSSEHTLMNV